MPVSPLGPLSPTTPSPQLPFAVGPDLLAAFGVTRQPCGTRSWVEPRRVAEKASERNTGQKGWRAWKQDALDKLVELAELTPARVRLVDAQLGGDFNALVWLQAPVPRWPVNGHLRIATEAIVHLSYQQSWLTDPPHGQMPVGIMAPHDFYAPNAAPATRGVLCLGALPAGIPIPELLYLAYLALTLQTVTLDETEGVLNSHACEFYRDHPQFIPLTRTSLLEPWSQQELDLPEAVVDSHGGQS